jgi:membrane protease YdiL (CAAX protease family)
MSELPQDQSFEPEVTGARPEAEPSHHRMEEDPQAGPSPLESAFALFENPFLDVEEEPSQGGSHNPEAPFFQPLSRPEIRPGRRIPHLGHVFFLLLLASIGLLGTSILTQTALHFHLFGVSTVKQALTDIHYTLGSMAVLYLITLGAGVLVFPLFWHKSFFDGIQWRASTAIRLRNRLFLAAVLCFILALLNGWLLPGPANTPIDKLFRTPSAAWMMFAFGVTFAPFFEEIVFRGFLLPALCTSFDWIAEKAHGEPSPPLDANGHPQWSLLSMALASIATSLPFAWMHAEQTSYALGPFMLLVCVSLVLCWTRLTTRSLAASVMVHSSYNFLLFAFMLFGTSGFRHMDKM